MLRPFPVTAPLLLLAAACAATPPAESRHVRVVSYNVKHGLGLDGRLDLERVARVLAALEPDIVLLQEIDERAARSGGVDQAAALGAALGMDHRFAPFMDFDGGRYGLATLSRLPVTDSQVVELPPGQREPRAALVVTVDLAGAPLRVANAHLDWLRDDAERVAQAEALGAALAAGGPGTVVLGGDLNDVPGSAALAALGRRGLERLGPTEGTFPADAPERTIDHFLVATPGPWRAHVSVVAEAVASDHRPVVLDLELGPR